MTDENRQPDAPQPSDADAPDASPRAEDKSPSPSSEIKNAGSLPEPEKKAATPESQAALTGKAPSGSSTSGTTVPASTTDPSKPAAPAPDTSKGPSPPGGASPSVGDPLKGSAQSDLEKAAKIAEAKARAEAAKQAAGDKAAPAAPAAAGAGAPKAPVKKKDEGPKPVDASGHPLVKRLREKLSDAITEATEFVGQLSVRVERGRIVEVCNFLKTDAKTPFNYLSDLTCVHFPDRAEAPFEVVYNLYSISGNERVRLKVATDEATGVESVTDVWPTANWMEREVFDLFGVPFANHPDLRRILLPEDWEGHPFRKEYPLEFMENNWTTKHLPEFTEVQREQLEQRRGYGLEILSVPAERRVREIFRSGKEVMPKDK